jgi:WD40 repeat protein
MPPPNIDPARTRMTKELRHGSPFLACRFDPTGRYVFAASQDFGIQRWEVSETTPPKTTLAGHRSWIRSLAFHAADRKLLSGDYHGKVLIWPCDAATPAPETTLEAHDGWLRAIAVAPDGQTFATCGNDHLVKIWSYPEARLVRTLRGHESHVYNLAFHPTEPFLVSGDLQGNLKQWSLQTGEQVRQFDATLLFRHDNSFRADIGGIRAMAFRPDGGQFAVTGITNVTNAFAGVGNPVAVVFDWSNGQRRQTLRPQAAFQGTGWGIAYHPSGFILGAAGGNNGALYFWRDDREPSVHTVTLPNNARDLAIHGDSVAIAFFDMVRVYELQAPATPTPKGVANISGGDAVEWVNKSS